MGHEPGVIDTGDLGRRVKARAYALGFDLCGIATLGTAGTFPQFERWLSLGMSAGMTYLERYLDQRRDRRLVHPGATTAIVVGLAYGGREPAGPVARYARGDDYHVVMRQRLRTLQAWLEAEVGRPLVGRPFVDTAPILERDLARQAGLGWIGKNTCLINPEIGSHFFIGSLFVGLELPADAPFDADRCGTCTRCLDACPTDALVTPHVLDARRCVSYWTIEHRGDIPESLHPSIGELLYGCDICQDVCPWNVKFSTALPPESPFRARDLVAKPVDQLARELIALTPETYAAAFDGSPMQRATLPGLQRNAAIVLANTDGAHPSDPHRAE